MTLAWASKALESPGVMASLFNYFNTAKETDCQIVAQGSREESSRSQALSASRCEGSSFRVFEELPQGKNQRCGIHQHRRAPEVMSVSAK